MADPEEEGITERQRQAAFEADSLAETAVDSEVPPAKGKPEAEPESEQDDTHTLGLVARKKSAKPAKAQDPYDIRSIFINRESFEYVKEADLKEGKECSEKYHKALQPIRWCLTFLGLLPVWPIKREDGRGAYSHRPFHVTSLWFHLQSVLHTLVFMLVIFNTGGILLDIPSQKAYSYEYNGKKISKTARRMKAEQEYFFRRNIVPALLNMMALLQCFVASYCFFERRHFIATYFTFWADSLEKVRIDAAKGVRKFMNIVLCIYFGIILVLIVIGTIRFAPLGTGAPGMLIVQVFRCFIPSIHSHPSFSIFRIVGTYLNSYILICSKVHILLFLFKAKLLTNLFKVWNNRMERVLHFGEVNDSHEVKTAKRTSFSHLFKDFVCILDLMDGCDVVFANIIETYFATQICGICFEVFYFYRSQAAKAEFDNYRQRDGLIMFLYIIRTSFVLITVSVTASDISEEAAYGLELVRRKGMLVKKTDEEIYFLLSMYVSYTGHYETALLGGKYFAINRGFLVTMTGLIFTYFLILIQFTPPLLLDVHEKTSLLKDELPEEVVNALLEQVE